MGSADQSPADSLINRRRPEAEVDQIVPVAQSLLEAHPADDSDDDRYQGGDPVDTAFSPGVQIAHFPFLR